ncbi:autotransporter-associated beta strand repeat-containing protein [Undibacterium sp. SXout11W]|uniref:two-partner secretion domain-containing protein n=1 Tax=Undibacterium sp. SXout11W TaxID=3413050 RepID=UPI003BF03847
MNKNNYRLVWSTVRGSWVVAPEFANARGKSGGGINGTVIASILTGLFGMLMGSCSHATGVVSLAPPPPLALPQGGVVTSGNAKINQTTTNQLTINQLTQQAVINWNSFNIGEQATVNFVQPNSNASVLNRVLSIEPTQIFGQLHANGQVYIVNPNGIVFGSGSRVDAGAIVASTLNISDANFMAGNNQFIRGTATGTITNQGKLTTAPGGYVALLGATVNNAGKITTPNGSVILAAANKLQLPVSKSGLITLALEPATVNAAVVNSPEGIISAPNGHVYLSAAAASGLVANAFNQGQIVANGGNVNLNVTQTDGLGETRQQGLIDVSNKAGNGGTIKLLGNRVGLFAGSQTLATGSGGGGTVLVGGDARGQGVDINANAVYMDKDATINVSADQRGNGGNVVLWSQDYTGFFGHILAQGGSLSGNGGAVETSSHTNLQAFGHVNAYAPNGLAGSWLLDPTDVTIVSGASNTNESLAAGIWTPSTNTAQIAAANINTDLSAGTNVSINTASSGTATGNITQNAGADILKNAGGNATFTMNAAGAITLNGNINSTLGTLNTNLNAGGGVSSSGNFNLNGGLLTINNSGNGILSGVISGSGGLTQSGSGTTILTGNNTYTGTTTVSSGTLQVGNVSTTGTLGSGAVTNNANFAVNRSDSFNLSTIASNAAGITGSGNVTVTSTGGGVTLDRSISLSASNSTLTVNAKNGINVNANDTATGAGKLTVNMTNTGASGISINANITTAGGKVTLVDSSTHGIALADTAAGTIDTRLNTSKSVTDSSNTNSGDVVIQTNGVTSGTITVSNNYAANVYARNITLDQTGGSIDSNTGAITTGTSISASGASSVIFNTNGSSTNLNAGGNINIAGNALAGTGIDFNQGNNSTNVTLNAVGIVSLKGSSLNSGYGVKFGGGQFATLNITGGTLNVLGTVNTSAGSSGTGVYAYTWNGNPGIRLAATGNATVEGVITGAGTGYGFAANGKGIGDHVFSLEAGANATVRGDNRASSSNTNPAVYGAGLVVKAGVTSLGGNSATGNASILAETNNASSNAINVDTAPVYLFGVSGVKGGLGYSSFSANGGNLLFQSNQGGINFASNSTAPNSQGTIADSGMRAKNITFDNTGAGMTVNGVVGAGSIDSATGAVTVRGTGAASGVVGVNLADTTYTNSQVTPNVTYTESYQATGNINISGASSDSNSTAINVATNLNAGGNVIIQSKGGHITLNTGSVTGNGSSAAYSGGIGAGGNLTVDNRGSTIAADGTVTLAGTADSGTLQGVTISNAGVSATGALSVYGGSGSNTGLFSSGLMQGGTVTVLGTTSSTVAALALSGSNTRITGSGASTLTGTNSSTGGGIYLGGTETLTVGTGGTLTETGLISNAGNLVANGTGTLVVSGNIINTGALTQSGTGTTILTGTNAYSGTTTINAGTLEIGNGGTTGTLGNGSVTNNANLVFNRSASSNVGNEIGGSGGLTQSGSGTTILSGNNTYAGTTTVSAGTLQVGNGGASGSLGSGGAVVLSNNANLSYKSNTTVNINNDISGAGNVSANANGTMSDLNLNSNINLIAGNLTLNATGAISQSPNMLLNGSNLAMTAYGGGIGFTGQRINSNVNSISLNAADNIFVTNKNAVTVAAKTTSNSGSIDIKTLDGTMIVGSVNGINGITTNGSGNVTLNATSSSGDGLHVQAPITANAGNISLTGLTSGSSGLVSGVYVYGTISGNSISVNGSSTNPSAYGLGYYGAFDKLNAITTLSLNGITNSSNGTGFYSYDGKYSSGTGMSIVGSANGGGLSKGVRFDDASTLVNASSGGIHIVGKSSPGASGIVLGGGIHR